LTSFIIKNMSLMTK